MLLGYFRETMLGFGRKCARQIFPSTIEARRVSKSPALRAISIALLCIVAGCSRAQESYLTIQMCISDNSGILKLKNIMKSVAESEELQFIDNSDQWVRNLNTMNTNDIADQSVDFSIDFHIEGPEGLGVTAGNLGLPPYQVALGFTEGTDAAKAHQLSDRLVQALSRQWQVETVPQGQGVFPMKSCVKIPGTLY